ncbi:MAG: hypothetical protein NC389_17175 [Acetatifactor muris]|nr:hypothetical protein [Acetatifactor muris]
MFDIFGEFDSVEELNQAAAGQKAEGDREALTALAQENGIDKEDAEDYFDGAAGELATPLMAAYGKLEVEQQAFEVYEIMGDWLSYIRIQCEKDERMARAVRRKGKSLKGCIAALLKWSFGHQYSVDQEVIKAAGISAGRCTLGIPGMARAHEIIRGYYLEEGGR